jgi:hypothetical protein
MGVQPGGKSDEFINCFFHSSEMAYEQNHGQNKKYKASPEKMFSSKFNHNPEIGKNINYFRMKPVFIPIMALVILLFLFTSGCTTSTGTPPATTPAPATTAAPAAAFTPAPAAQTIPVTASPVVTKEEPVRSLPPAQQVNLLLTKDRPTSKISLLYQGGPGDINTQKILMDVYTSNTTYQEYVMHDGKKPIPGDEIVAQGTREGDRCVVYVMSAGTSYKVMDEQVFAPRI